MWMMEIAEITDTMEEDYLTTQRSSLNHFNNFLRAPSEFGKSMFVVEYSKEAFSNPEFVASMYVGSICEISSRVDVVKIKKLTTTLQYIVIIIIARNGRYY